MNIPPQLKLFEACIKPILLYCSEIWSLDLIIKEKKALKKVFFPPVKVQIKFLKYLLGVNRGAVNLAVFFQNLVSLLFL